MGSSLILVITEYSIDWSWSRLLRLIDERVSRCFYKFYYAYWRKGDEVITGEWLLSWGVILLCLI